MNTVLKTGFLINPKTPVYSNYTAASMFVNYYEFRLHDTYRSQPHINQTRLYQSENETTSDVLNKNFFQYFRESFLSQQNENANINEAFEENFNYFIKLDHQDSTYQSIEQEIKSNSTRNYRWSNNYQVVSEGSDPLQIENVFMNLSSKHTWVDDKGVICFSQFPKEVISYFRKPYIIDPEVDTNQKFSFTKKPENFVFQKIRGRYNNSNLSKNSIVMSSNSYSDFNFMSKPSGIEDKKVSIIEFKNCSKGTTPVTRKFKTVFISNVTEKQNIFLTKKKIIVYKWNESKTDVEPVEAFYYSFGTFATMQYMSKYKKFRVYLLDFLQKIQQYQGKYLISIDEYNEAVSQQHKHYIKYWKNLPPVFKSFQDSDYNTILKNSNYDAHALELKEHSIASLGTIGQLSRIKEYTDYRDISKALSTMKNDLSSNENNIRRAKREIERQKQYIESYKASLREAERILSENKKNQEKYEVIKTVYPEQIKNLEDQFQSYKDKYSIALDERIKDKTLSKIGFNFISSLKDKGIVIDSITYWSKTDQESVRLCDSPTVALEAKQCSLENPHNWNSSDSTHLREIKFRILKPIIIRVDPAEKGDNCKKVMGGPYCVTITSNSLQIGLLTSNSIFGYDSGSNNFWIHPHTPAINMRARNGSQFKETLMSIRQACLGEASSALYKAFESADPRQAIYAAMTWVTSANSSDAWGKHWKFFPSMQDINLDSESADILLKESEKQEMIQKLQCSEEIIDNFFTMEFEGSAAGINTVPEPLEDPEVLQIIANEMNPEQPVQNQTSTIIETPFTDTSTYVPFSQIRNQNN